MRVLSVGALKGISNTCAQRNKALCELAEVDAVSTNNNEATLWFRIAYHLFLLGLPIRLPENGNENKEIRELILRNLYDVVWIDKGWTIAPETLHFIKINQPNCKIVSYSPDNMALRHNQSQQYLDCIPMYDLIVTNKSYICDDLQALGAKKVVFVNNTFDPLFHFPRVLNEEERERLGADVGFVGAWEKERCESILFLADNGVKVKVFGDKKWAKYSAYSPNLCVNDFGLYDEDYAKALSSFKMSLCFLRKMNYDQQTTRSVEIPACGCFMLAERTKEHEMMFKEGKEADFFSSDDELLEKCRFYLQHEDVRKRVAEAGRKRCIESDYTNVGMIKRVFLELNGEKNQ